MSVKNNAELTALNSSRIPDNNTRSISAEDVRSQIKDVIDSFLNIKGGGLVIQAESGYSTAITPSSDHAFATKKYVDDTAGAIAPGLSTTLNSGQVYVGSSGNVGTARTLSLSATPGTFALSNTGVFTFPNASASTRGLFTAAFGDARYLMYVNTADVLVSNTGANVFNRSGFLLFNDATVSGTKSTAFGNQASPGQLTWSYADSSNSDSISYTINQAQHSFSSSTVANGVYGSLHNKNLFQATGGGGTTYTLKIASGGLTANLAYIDTASILSATDYSIPEKGGVPQTFAMLSDITGTISGYVPYTGATTNTDLGNYTLTALSLQGGALYDASAYKIMIGFGDSTSVGSLATNNSAYSWLALFANGIGTTLVNKAIVGTTLVQFSPNDNSMIARIAEIPTKTSAYKCIVFNYGINDAYGGYGPFNAANFQAAYEQVIDACTAKGWAAVDIICITPPYAVIFVGNPTVKNIVLGLAASKGVTVIDAQQAMINNGGTSLNAPDNVHPSNAGHRVIYNACIAANYSTFKPFSTINQSLVVSGNLSVGNRIYGGDLTTDGLILEASPNLIDYQKRITSANDHYFDGVVKIGQKVTGSVSAAALPSIDLGTTFITGAIGTAFKIKLWTNTGIGISTTDGLSFSSAVGTGGKISSMNDHWFNGNLRVQSLLSGAVAAPPYIEMGNQYSSNTGTFTYNDLFLRGLGAFGGGGLGFSTTDGLVLFGAFGAGRVTAYQPFYTKGLASVATNILLGTTLTGSQTTPSYIDLGTSFSATAATNFKIRLWTNAGFTFSPGSVDYVTPSGLAHTWYHGTVNNMTLTAAGLLTLSGGATLGGRLSLAAGTTTMTPLVFISGTNVTTLLPGAVEYDGTNFLMTATTGRFKVAMSSVTTTGYIPYWKSDGSLDSNAAFSFSSTLGLTTSGLSVGYVAKTSTYSIANADHTIDCTSGTFTVTLPTAVGVTGKVFVVKNSGAGVITIATTSSQTIDGFTTKVLNTQYAGYKVQSNGANWIIIGMF